ncbi:hydroquinone glucosyltransferase-like [Wolffia australiana]
MLLSLFLSLPDLDARTAGEFRDLPGPVQLPGCVPLLGADLVDPCQDRSDEAYAWLLRQASSYPLAEAIFVNSFEAMEGATFTALAGGPPVHAVGPLVQSPEPRACTATAWLDGQPPGSVLFASFGSGGTLSLAQLTELALGLEASGQRFLWVVRRPSEDRADAAFFSVVDAENPVGFLPEGFLERTRGRGLVLPSWAPQARVLSHAATGGFMTHCGWNSVLESVVNGVPMIAWPLYAEQRMNARLLAEGVGVALRATPEENGLVGRVQVARLVRTLMAREEGSRLRQRVRRLQLEAARGLAEGGASHVALAKVVAGWKGSCQELRVSYCPITSRRVENYI